jgi:hypothetical protein
MDSGFSKRHKIDDDKVRKIVVGHLIFFFTSSFFSLYFNRMMM